MTPGGDLPELSEEAMRLSRAAELSIGCDQHPASGLIIRTRVCARGGSDEGLVVVAEYQLNMCDAGL